MIKTTLFIGLFLLVTKIFAQDNNVGFEDLKLFENRVKQVDQFVGRFNGTENIKGEKVAANAESKRQAWASILSPKPLNLSKNFFDHVLKSNSKLDMNSNNIFAFVKCKVKFENKEEQLTLVLVNEVNAKKEFRWAIRGAKADFLAVKAAKPEIGMVNPASHNLNFMDLDKALNTDKNNLPNYAWESYQPDYLTLVIYLIKNNKIQVLERGEVSFFFFDIKNWIVQLDYFPMTTSDANSGWLISDLIECKDSEELCKKTLLGISFTK